MDSHLCGPLLISGLVLNHICSIVYPNINLRSLARPMVLLDRPKQAPLSLSEFCGSSERTRCKL